MKIQIKNKRFVLIGAGNVAHHLAPALLKAGVNLCQIYSRTPESARELGMKTGITYTADINTIYPDCDVYIFCVSDDSLANLCKNIRLPKNALLLHTSGSLPLNILKPFASHFGVLYPLQTFSKKRNLDFREIPLCIEASQPEVLSEIRELALLLSQRVEEISSEKRKCLHLAAVFANNFTNHLYELGARILEKEGMNFNLLRPLIFETAHKVMLLPPDAAQTGPARRGDDGIIAAHKVLLKGDRKLLEIYGLMSESIRESAPKPQEINNEPDNKPTMLSLW